MSARLRVGISTLISVLLHAFLLFGIGFEVSRMLKHAAPPLEIILVNSKTAHKPVKADALAQANLAGGGNVAEKRRAKSPLPPVDTKEVRSDEVEARQEQLSQLERESKHLLAAIKDSETVQSDKRIADTHDLAQKSLEIARKEKFIGAPLEARVHLSANGNIYPLLEEYAKELPGLFIVSQVSLESGAGDEVSVKVERAEGQKCERCWKYTTDVGSHPDLPGICAACAEAVEEMIDG